MTYEEHRQRMERLDAMLGLLPAHGHEIDPLVDELAGVLIERTLEMELPKRLGDLIPYVTDPTGGCVRIDGSPPMAVARWGLAPLVRRNMRTCYATSVQRRYRPHVASDRLMTAVRRALGRAEPGMTIGSLGYSDYGRALVKFTDTGAKSFAPFVTMLEIAMRTSQFGVTFNHLLGTYTAPLDHLGDTLARLADSGALQECAHRHATKAPRRKASLDFLAESWARRLESRKGEFRTTDSASLGEAWAMATLNGALLGKLPRPGRRSYGSLRMPIVMLSDAAREILCRTLTTIGKPEEIDYEPLCQVIKATLPWAPWDQSTPT